MANNSSNSIAKPPVATASYSFDGGEIAAAARGRKRHDLTEDGRAEEAERKKATEAAERKRAEEGAVRR